jgi:hypothetical protein
MVTFLIRNAAHVLFCVHVESSSIVSFLCLFGQQYKVVIRSVDHNITASFCTFLSSYHTVYSFLFAHCVMLVKLLIFSVMVLVIYKMMTTPNAPEGRNRFGLLSCSQLHGLEKSQEMTLF